MVQKEKRREGMEVLGYPETGLGRNAERKAVASELGREETGSISSQQAIFTHALSFSSAKG